MSLINHLIASTLPYIPKSIVGFFSKRYIAGETLEDAVRTARELMQQGACVTLDVLGEDVTRKEEATGYAEQYIRVLETIRKEKLDANVSLKPTQMGLKISRDFCLETIGDIAAKATEMGNFVRIDMEDISCTDDTFWLYRQLKSRYNTGTVLQAYLRRSDSDLDELIPLQANLRLCKGIYREPYQAAYQDREIIRWNYLHLLERLLEGGCYVGIATHDELLVWGALRLIKKMNLARDRYEFQMLLGVREPLRRLIIAGGHRLRVYVPFGAHWHAYSIRRLKENPQIAGHVLQNIFEGSRRRG